MKSDTLSLNTIINELDCLKKAVFFQWSVKKKKKKRFGAACNQMNRKSSSS